MAAALISEDVVGKVYDHLKLKRTANKNDDAIKLLTAYNDLDPSFKHKLSVVQFGITWVGVDFDPHRSCYYNPAHLYGQYETFWQAAVSALAIRLHYMPGYGFNFGPIKRGELSLHLVAKKSPGPSE